MLAVLLAAALCSMGAFPDMRSTYDRPFVGTAEADTVEAGPGRVGAKRFAADAGVEPVIHGQRVRVERLTVHADSALRRAVADAGGRAIVVPWSVGPDCGTTRWTRSARWMAPGTRGLFFATLRDRRYWIGGVPTFDAHNATDVPYPGAPAIVRYFAQPWAGGLPSAEPPLDADEMLSFFDALPAFADDTPPPGATDALMRWADEHPSLARRPPAHRILWLGLLRSEETRIRALESPLAGTYRFTVTLSGGEHLTLYARTTRRPAGPDEDWAMSVLLYSPDLAFRRPAGYDLPARTAERETELPRTRSANGRTVTDDLRLTVAEMPSSHSADSTVWRASVSFQQGAGVGARESIAQLRKARTPGHLAGRLVRDREGRVRFEEEVRRDGKLLISIAGERISEVVLREP